nr:uncharacterized protein LOC105856996 [Microcebus murinus]
MASLERSQRRRHRERRSPGCLEAVTLWQRERRSCQSSGLRDWGYWGPRAAGALGCGREQNCAVRTRPPRSGGGRAGASPSRSCEGVKEPQTFADSRGRPQPTPAAVLI